jgi:hypothetical protein
MSEPFTRAERDALLGRIREVEARIWPGASGPAPHLPERSRLLDTLYALQGEYADRLPRVAMSACPFTGDVVKRAFDPFGLDGPWWQKDRTFSVQEPGAPPTFEVLLGALDLRGREPAETTETVIAGPDVPFVVPRLLSIGDMVAVIARIALENGDVAYPIGYFSHEDVHPSDLHQSWTRGEVWYKVDGQDGWVAMNDEWDFDLAPWIAKGKVRWIRPGDSTFAVVPANSNEPCPYVGLEGDRLPQFLGDGARDLGDLPNGEPLEPFES